MKLFRRSIPGFALLMIALQTQRARRWRPMTFLVPILAVMALLGGQVLPGAAQTTGQGDDQAQEASWSIPINLSHSGGAADPKIFLDSNGVQHVLWLDKFGGIVYTNSSDGVNWSTPVMLDLPFRRFPYQVVTAPGNKVFVFWVTAEKRLMGTQVDAAHFTDPTSWSFPVVVQRDVFRFDVAVTPKGAIHIAYLRVTNSETGQPGIYSFSSLDGSIWTAPVMIYASPYFRTLNVEGGPESLQAEIGALTVHADIAVVQKGDQEYVHVAWENPALKRVFYATSPDGGRTWQEPQVVDGPSAASPYLSAQGINLYPLENSMLRLWQAIEAGGTCSQKYQVSEDGGVSWSEPQVMFEEFNACPDTIQILATAGGGAVALTGFSSEIFVTRWDGKAWSTAVRQGEISTFVDPESYNSVKLECQTGVLVGNQLVIVGCDSGPGGDIWQAQLDITQLNKTIERTSNWSEPVQLPVGVSKITQLAVTSDELSNVHVIWSQPEIEKITKSVLKTNIFYASYNAEGGAAGPYTIYEGMDGAANQFTLASGPDARLFAAWTGGLFGSINFSWANARQAANASGWSPAVTLQEINAVGREPALRVLPNGGLVVAYAIPLNEGRGVYLVRSNDGGKEWSKPVAIFTAASERCDMIEQTRLAADPAGETLVVQWVCSTIPGGIGPLGLYASRSTDGGQTWSAAEEIVSGSVIWNQVIDTPSAFHRLWQTYEPGQISIWHAISTDQGLTWEPPKNTFTSNSRLALTDLVTDAAGQLYLAHIDQEEEQSPTLHVMIWNGESWALQESLALKEPNITDITAMGAAVLRAGRFVVAYAHFNLEDEANLQALTFVSIPVVIPPTVEATPPPTSPDQAESTPTPQAAATATAERPLIGSTSTATLSALAGSDLQAPPASDASAGIFIAVTASALLISAILGARLLWMRTRSF